MTAQKKTKIMFVCLGNICRSPVAHAVFDSKLAARGVESQFVTESSGTGAYHVGEPADSRMRATAKAHGVTIDHPARHLKPKDLETFDLILAMDQQNLSNIQRLANSDAQMKKIKLFRDYDPQGERGAEVPDPYYGGAAGFEEVFSIVDRTADALLDDLLTSAKDG